MTTRTAVYDRTTIALHWLTAFSVVVLWIIGQTADWIPDGPVNTAYWSVHVVLGFVLAGVLGWRIMWRRTAGRRLQAADSGALHAFAKTTHYLLYTLLLVVVVLGIVNRRLAKDWEEKIETATAGSSPPASSCSSGDWLDHKCYLSDSGPDSKRGSRDEQP